MVAKAGYKGMLIDGQKVAVKKSKIGGEDHIQEFINELVVLSHLRHIVKLIGFCLEMQVPLLVYEYISNGNLFDRIHNNEPEDETLASWEVRVRIAKEIAEWLCYLHTTASTPIFHRDIKTANIMLDDNNKAKLADFGISRSVSEDQTHLTTIVIGTPRYLDPEYHQSNQYTEKSDVYSYGIVLAELITGDLPICFKRSPKYRRLATYFNRAMNENRLMEIIDAQIIGESKVGKIVAAAKIAKNCLNPMTRERPVMRQVLMELELNCSSPEQLQPHVCEEEEVCIEVEKMNYVVATEPASQVNVATSSLSM
ncbi:unnamed protein product [Eruca vesicaria subsp. sativa]|uniref:Protein kinase domain-containing protein n=1 Tax=Eruca vesicaria subsp. sativa TaxID=29727 RepID=A0ABC8LB37_ERUVS|nr:unnamed protein product [Eruca vesicaria subsp. sativa]